jgi:signal transduction histidine kinase
MTMAKILVVDDARDVRALLVRYLTGQGYDVAVAENGREALERLPIERPDVVLLDIDMPEMDGIQACHRIKADEQFQGIPVIMVTAMSSDRDIIQGLDAGADDYVSKPFTLEVLSARIRSAVRAKISRDTIARMNEHLRSEIEQRKLMEQELAEAQKLEAIGHLAAGLAHEINTPMQYIGTNLRFTGSGFTALARLMASYERLLEAARHDRPEPRLVSDVDCQLQAVRADGLVEEIPKAIRQSLEGVGHVAAIIRAIEDCSQPSRGGKAAADLNQVVQNAIIVSQNHWKPVAELIADFDPSLPPIICCPSELAQATVNLLVNAAQAIAGAEPSAAGKGRITVRTRRRDDLAEIRVEDTGMGIPEAIRTKVFDQFFTTRDVGQGMGQGLSIAQAIVVGKHGGTIGFESQTGQGTAFTVRLPLDGGVSVIPGE